MPSGVNATVIPYCVERRAQPSVRRVERGQDDARDRRRQCEGQIDQRVDDAPSRETGSAPAPTRRAKPKTALTPAAASDAPRLNRYDATTRGSVIVSQNARPRHRHRSRGQRRERNQHDEAQVEDREPHREAESREDPAACARIMSSCRPVCRSDRTCRRRRNASSAPSASRRTLRRR